MTERFDIRPDAQGDNFIFHYTTPLGLAAILDSGTLRFSSLDRMNDPRERQMINLGFRFSGPTPVMPTSDHMTHLSGAVDEIVRGGAFLACFTSEGTQLSRDGFYTRGWARPRNWAQYADDHRGACLVFDRQQFIASTDSWLSAQPSRLTFDLRHGPIEYDDRQSLEADDDWLTGASTDEAVIRAMAEEWRTKYWPQLLFRKSTDWSSEMEYRVLVWPVNRQQPYIPIIDSLVGIILGSEFPSPEKSVLGARLFRIRAAPLQIGVMSWPNGAAGTSAPNPDLEGFEPADDESVLYNGRFRPTGFHPHV